MKTIIDLLENSAKKYANNPPKIQKLTSPFENIGNEIKTTPEKYTEWFKICFKEVIKSHKNIK